jgi:putative phosphoribosyl transferase
MTRSTADAGVHEDIRIETGGGPIDGALAVPENALGVVLFAHGSGSSRHSPRNKFVAESLNQRRIGTLLIDLLTPEEEAVDVDTAHHRFDIELLRIRLLMAADWLAANESTQDLPIALFGASTGAAAALAAAAQRPEIVAVVSRGGRPDLAGDALRHVHAATLLIVGDLDFPVIPLNRAAFSQLERSREKEMTLVGEATHLFEEPGALEEVARLAGDWFVRHFEGPRRQKSPR